MKNPFDYRTQIKIERMVIMKRLNKDVSVEKEMELLNKLYDYMGHDIEGLDNDTEHDYLTCNSGHNGKDYFWYMDEAKSVAIDMDGNIIDESNFDETLEGILYSEDN